MIRLPRAQHARVLLRRGAEVAKSAPRRLAPVLRSAPDATRSAARSAPARIAGIAAAIMAGVCFAATTFAGSYAYLNSTASTTSGSSVTAGTSALTLQQGAGAASTNITLTTSPWTKMLPGDFAGQAITITNTGDSPLAVSTRVSAASAWEFRVTTGACPASLSPASTAQSTSPSSLVTLAAGASTTACIQAYLPTSAPNSAQGTTPVLALYVDGVQSA